MPKYGQPTTMLARPIPRYHDWSKHESPATTDACVHCTAHAVSHVTIAETLSSHRASAAQKHHDLRSQREISIILAKNPMASDTKLHNRSTSLEKQRRVRRQAIVKIALLLENGGVRRGKEYLDVRAPGPLDRVMGIQR